jgi:hypothetical protein
VIVPIGDVERSEPPLVMAAIAMRAALAAEEQENASLKAQALK